MAQKTYRTGGPMSTRHKSKIAPIPQTERVRLSYTLETPEHDTTVTLHQGDHVLGQVRSDMSRQPFVRPFELDCTWIFDGLAELGRMRLERLAREGQDSQKGT